jgi:hypothetical protein
MAAIRYPSEDTVMSTVGEDIGADLPGGPESKAMMFYATKLHVREAPHLAWLTIA